MTRPGVAWPDGGQALRVVPAVSDEDRKKALSEMAFQASGLTSESGVRVGKLAGAEWLLAGSFTELRGSLTLSARVIKVETGETVAAASETDATEHTLAPPEKSIVKRASLALAPEVRS